MATADGSLVPTQPPTVWHFAISHYTEKARWALDWKRIPHHRKELFLDYPIRVPLRTGQGSLPVLFWEGKAICDSTRIIEFLEDKAPTAALYPEDPVLRQRALKLEDWLDEEVGPHVRALVVNAAFERGPETTAAVFGMSQPPAMQAGMRRIYPVFRPLYELRHRMRGDRIALARSKLREAAERLPAEIGGSGYLAGNAFSVADLTAAAILYPLAQPAEYPYSPPPVMDEIIDELFGAAEYEPIRSWVAGTYARHRGSYCAA